MTLCTNWTDFIRCDWLTMKVLRTRFSQCIWSCGLHVDSPSMLRWLTMKILQCRCSRFFVILFAKHSTDSLSDNYINQIRVKENHFPRETYRISILSSLLIAMNILLLDFFMVSLQLDIHMEFYSALEMSKTDLFTISKSKRNMMTMAVRGNAALWLAHFMTLAMFISIRCGTKPGERQRNSILLLPKLLVLSAAPKWNFTKWIWKYSF